MHPSPTNSWIGSAKRCVRARQPWLLVRTPASVRGTAPWRTRIIYIALLAAFPIHCSCARLGRELRGQAPPDFAVRATGGCGPECPRPGKCRRAQGCALASRSHTLPRRGSRPSYREGSTRPGRPGRFSFARGAGVCTMTRPLRITVSRVARRRMASIGSLAWRRTRLASHPPAIP